MARQHGGTLKYKTNQPRYQQINHLVAQWKGCDFLCTLQIYSLQNLLSRTQAGPGRTVKKEQEEISPNHVQRVNLISVYVTTEHWRGVHHVSDNLWKTEHETDVVILVWPNAKRQVISHPLLMILLKIPAGNSPIAPRLGRKGL